MANTDFTNSYKAVNDWTPSYVPQDVGFPLASAPQIAPAPLYPPISPSPSQPQPQPQPQPNLEKPKKEKVDVEVKIETKKSPLKSKPPHPVTRPRARKERECTDQPCLTYAQLVKCLRFSWLSCWTSIFFIASFFLLMAATLVSYYFFYGTSVSSGWEEFARVSVSIGAGIIFMCLLYGLTFLFIVSVYVVYLMFESCFDKCFSVCRGGDVERYELVSQDEEVYRHV